jgi:hypothetical protein
MPYAQNYGFFRLLFVYGVAVPELLPHLVLGHLVKAEYYILLV